MIYVWMRCRHFKWLRCCGDRRRNRIQGESGNILRDLLLSHNTAGFLRRPEKAYDEGFRAGKEIIAAEFRTRTELNQPYVWKPPMISEVDMPARVVSGMMIPTHREFVIVRPGYWVRADNVLSDQ